MAFFRPFFTTSPCRDASVRVRKRGFSEQYLYYTIYLDYLVLSKEMIRQPLQEQASIRFNTWISECST